MKTEDHLTLLMMTVRFFWPFAFFGRRSLTHLRENRSGEYLLHLSDPLPPTVMHGREDAARDRGPRCALHRRMAARGARHAMASPREATAPGMSRRVASSRSDASAASRSFTRARTVLDAP